MVPEPFKKTATIPRTSLKKYNPIAVAMSIFLSLPLGLVMLATGNPERLFPVGLVYGALVFLLPFLAIWIVLRLQDRLVFFGTAGLIVAALVSLSVIAGIRIHRDFYSAAFMYIMATPVLVLYYMLSVQAVDPISKGALGAFSTAGFILSVFYSQWIILMGYAISTRAEPRPMQALAYNLYNLVMVLLLFSLSRSIRKETYHTLLVGASAVTVDGRDLTGYVGKRKADLVAAFASAPDRTLRCPEIQAILVEGTLNQDDPSCELCGGTDAKATLCRKYRNTYNNILDLKKLLEFLEIGTITAPDNKRKVLAEGWKMNLFQNARVLVRR